MTDISVAFQKTMDIVRGAKTRKSEARSEGNSSDGKAKRKKVEDVAKDASSAKEEKTDKPKTAPIAFLDPKHTSDEWDASKTPPSRFQQRRGSVYATPNSRDSHIDRHADRDAKFHELHDKKFGSGKSRSTSSRDESCL